MSLAPQTLLGRPQAQSLSFQSQRDKNEPNNSTLTENIGTVQKKKTRRAGVKARARVARRAQQLALEEGQRLALEEEQRQTKIATAESELKVRGGAKGFGCPQKDYHGHEKETQGQRKVQISDKGATLDNEVGTATANEDTGGEQLDLDVDDGGCGRCACALVCVCNARACMCADMCYCD